MQVVTRVHAEHPFGVAAGGGRVYWSEWVSRGVFALDDGAARPVRLRTAAHRPMALVAVTPDLPVSISRARAPH